MCGIVGVAGDLFVKDVDVFKQLLYVDTLRGDHSTGVASVNNMLKDCEVFKAVGPAADLIERKHFDSVVSTGKRVIIGHNRYGTMGARVKENAHPFDFPSVVGVHNGTVDYQSKGRMNKGHEFGTDSEAIYHNIHVEGIEATVQKLEGAYCLVFFDKETNELCMIRNKERPMFYAFNKKRTVMYWASELGMLHWILYRNNVDFKDIYDLNVDTLYCWKVPRNNAEWPDATRTKLEGKKKEPLVQRFQGRHWLGRGAESYGADYSKTTRPDTTSKTSDAQKAEEGAVKDAHAQLVEDIQKMTAEEWDAIQFDDDDPFGWHTDETIDQWRARVAELQEKVSDEDEAPWTDPVKEAIGQAFGPAEVVITKPKSNVIPLVSQRYVNPVTQSEMTKEEFEEIVQFGCDWCQGDIEFGDKVRLFRTDTGDIECFCQKCVEGNHTVREYMER